MHYLTTWKTQTLLKRTWGYRLGTCPETNDSKFRKKIVSPPQKKGENFGYFITCK
jgi:hypothetical protein